MSRAVIYCLVPEALAADLLCDLRAHFAADDRVQVIVDRRQSDRRAPYAGGLLFRSREEEADAGRRTGTDRRRAVLPRAIETMPPDLAHRARAVRFVQRMVPAAANLTDLRVEQVVERVRAGEAEAATELYWRVFERVHSRLCVLLGDPDLADRFLPAAFGRILDSIDQLDGSPVSFEQLLYAAVDDAATTPAAGTGQRGEQYPTLAITDPSLDEPVTVVSPDPRWHARGLLERDRIRYEAFDHVVGVELIGSIALPGIVGRPIVDLLVGVQRMQEPGELRRVLLDLGYRRCGDAGTPGRAYYRKRDAPLGFDVHVAEHDATLWRDAIRLRDFLLRSPQDAHQWATVKQQAARARGATLLRYSERRARAMRDLIELSGLSPQRAA